MFARMTVARPVADQFDNAVAIVQDTFASAAQQQQGYRGFLLFVDRQNQHLTGISLWESDADRQASSGASGYYQDGIARFAEFLSSPAVTTDVDIALCDLPCT